MSRKLIEDEAWRASRWDSVSSHESKSLDGCDLVTFFESSIELINFLNAGTHRMLRIDQVESLTIKNKQAWSHYIDPALCRVDQTPESMAIVLYECGSHMFTARIVNKKWQLFEGMVVGDEEIFEQGIVDFDKDDFDGEANTGEEDEQFEVGNLVEPEIGDLLEPADREMEKVNAMKDDDVDAEEAAEKYGQIEQSRSDGSREELYRSLFEYEAQERKIKYLENEISELKKYITDRRL